MPPFYFYLFYFCIHFILKLFSIHLKVFNFPINNIVSHIYYLFLPNSSPTKEQVLF
nr:MAG TPA: hypothetical protein [Caudoviricetes sp.]